MTKSILIATFAFSLLSSAAIAADAVDQIPAPPAATNAPAAFSWAGGYAGALGGYGWLDAKSTYEGETTKVKFNGGRLGGFAGWNFDASHSVILGIEGDVNHDWNKTDFDGGNFGTQVSGSARARAGYAVDKALFYVAGGWAAAKAKLNYTDTDSSYSKTFSGWTVGAGVDYALTNHIFTRAEYRYNDFGSKVIDDAKFNMKQNVVNVGVGVKF